MNISENMDEYYKILNKLIEISNPDIAIQKSSRGINPKLSLGIKVSDLKIIAKETGRDHKLALELYKSGIHEAKKLACFIAKPKEVSENQMESWALEFDSWDLCDTCCMNLFDKTPFIWGKAFEWSSRDEEFVKRAGFVLMVQTVTRDKISQNSKFEEFFPIIERESIDDRNFVKKAISWALRTIGKRNIELNEKAINFARELQKRNEPSAKCIARDALKELQSKTVNIRNYGI